MRKLNAAKREMIVKCLTEGVGVRATARLVGCSKLTVMRLLCDLGMVCQKYHDKHVRGLTVARAEIDEVWGFVGAKEKSVRAGKTGHGSVWVWSALDASTRLVLGYHVGGRSGFDAVEFLSDLADRIVGRVQINTDGWSAYEMSIRAAFGDDADWARVVKIFGKNPARDENRYSQPECIGCMKEAMIGNPDLSVASTSLTERQNLNLRTQNRRMTRLTNAFSKKIVNHAHAIALHYFAHNFMKKTTTLKKTPAMAAGLADRQWTATDLINLLVEAECQHAFSPVGSRINRADRA